jgi:hypothetical protein
MVDTLKAQNDRIKAITADAKAIGDQLVLARARIAGTTPSRSVSAAIDKLNASAEKLAAELAELSASAATLRSHLSYSETWKFPEKVADRNGSFNPEESKLTEWLGTLLKPSLVAGVDRSRFTVGVTLKPLVAEASCPEENAADTEKEAAECVVNPVSVNGFVFRQPVEATLTVSGAVNPKPMVSKTVTAPQLGRFRVLPLRSRWGEKNTLTASFAADGRPTMIEYKAEKAAGVDMLKAAGEAAEAAVGIQARIDAKKTADAAAAKADAEALKKAELDDLNNQVALLEAKVKLAKLTQPDDPQLAALEAQLAVLRMEKEKSELEAAIRHNQGQ